MNHDKGQKCGCSADHNPDPLELNEHHVWPLGMGGADVASNKVWLCPTAHTNVHEILRIFLKEGVRSYTDINDRYEQVVNRYCYAVALRGYQAWLSSTLHTA